MRFLQVEQRTNLSIACLERVAQTDSLRLLQAKCIKQALLPGTAAAAAAAQGRQALQYKLAWHISMPIKANRYKIASSRKQHLLWSTKQPAQPMTRHCHHLAGNASAALLMGIQLLQQTPGASGDDIRTDSCQASSVQIMVRDDQYVVFLSSAEACNGV